MNIDSITQKFMIDTQLIELNYSKTFIDEIMSDKFPNNICVYSNEELTTIGGALVQYHLFLVQQRNLDKAAYTGYKKQYDYEKRKIIAMYSIKGRSGDDVLGKVYETDEGKELLELEEKVNKAEVRYSLFEEIPDAIREFINMVKKELERRQVESKFPRSFK